MALKMVSMKADPARWAAWQVEAKGRGLSLTALISDAMDAYLDPGPAGPVETPKPRPTGGADVVSLLKTKPPGSGEASKAIKPKVADVPAMGVLAMRRMPPQVQAPDDPKPGSVSDRLSSLPRFLG